MPTAPTKVVGRRLVGFILDSIVIWIIGSVLFALMAKKNVPVPADNQVHVVVNDENWVLSGTNYTVWILLIVVAVLLIGVVLEGMTGWTPGKLALGVRVVDKEGQTPGMGRAFLRLIGWLVDGVPWFFLWGLCGLITSASSKGNRRVGDMFASTYVVKKEAIGRPVVLDGAGFAEPAYPGPAYPGPPAPGTAPTPGAPPAVARDAFGNPVAPPYPGAPSGAAQPAAPVARPGTPVTQPATQATPPAPTGLPAADWYPDPSGTKRLRYWDGRVWTDHTAD